jgi:23S rRNA (cytosine1962-C5)-methyltransferase
VRLLTRGAQLPSRPWAEERFAQALERRRERMGDVADLRLVHAEADGLPGLVVERIGGYAVVSPDTLGAEKVLLPWLLEAIAAQAPHGVLLRALAPVRLREGLQPRLEMLQGRAPDGPVALREGDIRYEVDLMGGQKTGHYFDQRDNRALCRTLAAGRRVLDVFSYTGGFAIAAALGGASEVEAVESSADAADALLRNAAVNGVEVSVRTENAFDLLRELSRERRRYDLIVLDPPPFARGREHLEGALRAYKEINLRAMRMLAPGGYLLTATCSHAVSLQDFLDVLAASAADAAAPLTRVAVRGPSPDHPVRVEVPETDYLHLVVLQRD